MSITFITTTLLVVDIIDAVSLVDNLTTWLEVERGI